MIRRVTIDDVETYRAVRLRALADSPSSFGSTLQAESDRPHNHWVDRVARSATGDARTTLLAFDGPHCVGLVGAVEDDLGADRQLVSMWVAPTHRGTGIAVELVEAVLTWAKVAGARHVGLWVTRGNDRAQRFYERMGFTVTGDVQPLPSDPCKEEIRMIRRLATGDEQVVLVGRIASGERDLARWMTKYADAYRRATGVDFYPGSLNVLLDEPWSLPPRRIRLAAEDVGVDVNLVPCTFRSTPAYVFRTDKAEAGGPSERSVIEILSPLPLRRTFGLEDGTTVDVKIMAV